MAYINYTLVRNAWVIVLWLIFKWIKRIYQAKCTRHVSRITFIRYSQCRKVGKTNIIRHILEACKRPKQILTYLIKPFAPLGRIAHWWTPSILTRFDSSFSAEFQLCPCSFNSNSEQDNQYWLNSILLTIVLSVLLRYTDFNYPFGIFKLFLRHICNYNC
jgi:hypothetical protein